MLKNPIKSYILNLNFLVNLWKIAPVEEFIFHPGGNPLRKLGHLLLISAKRFIFVF